MSCKANRLGVGCFKRGGVRERSVGTKYFKKTISLSKEGGYHQIIPVSGMGMVGSTDAAGSAGWTSLPGWPLMTWPCSQSVMRLIVYDMALQPVRNEGQHLRGNRLFQKTIFLDVADGTVLEQVVQSLQLL